MTDIALWDDNPSTSDLLGFEAIVSPVLKALDSQDLDPVTIGIHGPWGSGKSSVLELLAEAIDKKKGFLLIRVDPWEYVNQIDVKGTIIGEVLGSLKKKFKDNKSIVDKTKELLQRVSWNRIALSLSKGIIGIPLGISPNLSELLDAFTPKSEQDPDSITGFRADFEKLIDGLPDIERVVLLVDDLDRCLPEAVMATLEAIKLFLSVPRMAFIIAADQDMVRDAISASLVSSNRGERFAGQYLEKIIQLPVYLPRLAPQDAETYIALLIARTECSDTSHYDALVRHCQSRRESNKWPLLGELGNLDWKPSDETLLLAGQIAQGLGSDRTSNPRQIKRFLNAFGVRRHIATARGLDVSPAIIAKLFILEDRYRPDFDVLASVPEGERRKFLERWENWAKGVTKKCPKGLSKESREWAAADPSLILEETSSYISLAAMLASGPIAGFMDDELRQLLSDLIGPSEAVQEEALASVAERTSNDQKQLVDGLLMQARRDEDLGRIITALVGMAKQNDQLSDHIASGIRDSCFNRIDPAGVYDLATSGISLLEDVARDISKNENIEPDVRKAAKMALEGIE
jgi:hypothetical protein